MIRVENISYYLIFNLCFICFTAIGTVLHELGHLFAANALGYSTKLNYNSMSWNHHKSEKKLTDIYIRNTNNIENGLDFEEKEEFENARRKLNLDKLLISIAGPAQTMLTGILGLMLIFYRRHKQRQYGFSFLDWLAVFLSLFWLREIFNPLMSIIIRITKGNGRYFGGDEAKISEMIMLPTWVLPVGFGIVALFIVYIVLFKIIPKDTRIPLILSGITGGFLGFILWMNFLGPFLLPIS